MTAEASVRDRVSLIAQARNHEDGDVDAAAKPHRTEHSAQVEAKTHVMGRETARREAVCILHGSADPQTVELFAEAKAAGGAQETKFNDLCEFGSESNADLCTLSLLGL